MSILTKDQILSVNDIKLVEVETPEWGGSVLIKGMSAFQRDSFERVVIEKKLRNCRATVASQCIVDEDGKPLFTSADINKLAEKSAAPLSRIFDKVLELSGATEKDIDEYEKN